MRRFRYLAIAAVLAALMGTTLAACSQEQTPQAESLELSGQTTVFTVGEEFSTGELSVTVVYDDGTRQAASADDYTVDSSDYDKTAAGDYEIVVSLNGTQVEERYTVTVSAQTYALTGDGVTFRVGDKTVTEASEGQTVTVVYPEEFGYTYTVRAESGGTALKVQENTFAMPAGAVTAEVSKTANEYPVTAPEGVTFTSGAENGKTTVESELVFTVSVSSEVILSRVRANGIAAIEEEDGSYSVRASRVLSEKTPQIEITLETASRFMLDDFDLWGQDGMALEKVTGGVKVTQNNPAQDWNFKKAQFEIDTQRYTHLALDIDGLTGTAFRLQFEGTTDAYKPLCTGGRYVFSLKDDLGIAESGTYTLNIYLEGAREGAFVYVRDLMLLTSEDENVHSFGAPVTVDATCHTAGTVTSTCETCGRCHIDTTEPAFLFAERNRWESTIQLEYVDHTAKFTLATDDPDWEGPYWGVASRKVTLKTTDYLRFSGTGNFKVELKGANDANGTVIIGPQWLDGDVFVVPVNTVVKEDGEYTLLVYVDTAEKNSVHTVTECFILSAQDENVHSFGEWKEDENGKSRVCGVCGFEERVDKLTVTFETGEEDVVLKAYAGETVESREAPAKAGYTFDGWYDGETKFNFEAPLNKSVTLVPVYTANADTAYRVEYYEQQADGSYKLAETKNLSGTTDTTAEAPAWEPGDGFLKLDTSHADSKLSGTIAGDGSLVLKVYYSYEKLEAYDLSAFRASESVRAEFDTATVSDGDLAMLEVRKDGGVVTRLYASVTSGAAVFDVRNLDLSGCVGVIAVSGKEARTVAVTASAVVAQANVGDALAAGVVNVDGIDSYGPPAEQLTDGAVRITNGTQTPQRVIKTVQVFYAGDFDYATVELSGLSWCGSGGADQLFVQNQTGQTLGLLDLNGVYGSETHVTVTFTKEQYGSGLKFIFYLYCVGDNQACKDGHGDEWLRIDNITFWKENMEAGKTQTLDTDGFTFRQPSEQPFFSTDSLRAGTVTATFEGVAAGTQTMLAVRERNGEVAAVYYAQTVEAGGTVTAAYAVEAFPAACDLTAVSADGKFAALITAAVPVAQADVGDARESGTVNVNGIDIYGPPAEQLTDGAVRITNGTQTPQRVSKTFEVFYAGDFDYATVELSGLSWCGSGGADQLFVQNQAGETLGLLNLSGVYGSETHVTVTFTKEQYGNGLKFIFYLYCVGDNQACKEGHGDEWLRIDTISFMKNEQLQSGPLCDVSDEIGYLAPQA